MIGSQFSSFLLIIVLFHFCQSQGYTSLFAIESYLSTQCNSNFSALLLGSQTSIIDSSNNWKTQSNNCILSCGKQPLRGFNTIKLESGDTFYHMNSISTPYFSIILHLTIVQYDGIDISNANVDLKFNGISQIISFQNLDMNQDFCSGGNFDKIFSIKFEIQYSVTSIPFEIRFINNFPSSIGIVSFQISYAQCLPGCLTCENFTTCLQCQNTNLFFGQRCISTCPSNQYLKNGNCHNCHSSCLTCYGSSLQQCTSCIPGSYLNSQYKCASGCSSPNIINPLLQTCLTSLQQNCSISSGTTCSACKQNYQYQSGACIRFQSDCPANYYFDNSTSTCQQSTNHCIFQTNSQCLICEYGYQITSSYNCQQMVINSGTFQLDINNSPTNFYSNTQLLQNISCNLSCSTCTGPMKSDCLQCPSGNLFFGMCFPDCGTQRYYDFSKQQCFSCAVGCTTCFGILTSQCWSCQSGFSLSNTQCTPNLTPSCLTRQYYDYSVNLCLNCIINCEICNNSLTCTTCSTGYYQKNQQSCLLIPIFQFEVENATSPENTIIISLNQGNNLIVNVDNFLLSFDQNISFTFSFTQIQTLKYTVTFQFENNPPQKMNLTVSYNDSSLVNQTSQTLEVKFTYAIDNDTKSAAQIISSSTAVITLSVMITGISFVLTSYFPFLSTLVDLSELFYLQLFLEFKEPYNLNLFLLSFQAIQMNFLPNLFSLYLDQLPQQTTKPIFDDNNQDGFFLTNTGSVLSIIIIFLFMHLFLKIIYFLFLKRKNNWIQKKIELLINLIQKQSYLQILEIFYLQIVFSGFLQLFNISNDSTNEKINFIILSFCFLFILPAPFLILFLLKKRKYEEYLKNFYEEMKIPDHKFFIYLRKIIFSFSITILYGMNYLQISLFCASSLMVTLSVAITKPYENSSSNKKNLITEIIFFFSISFSYLIIDENYFREMVRISISWVIIGLFSLVMMKEIFCMLKEVIFQIIRFFKERKLKSNALKITPTPEVKGTNMTQIIKKRWNQRHLKRYTSSSEEIQYKIDEKHKKRISNQQILHKNIEDFNMRVQNLKDEYLQQKDLSKSDAQMLKVENSQFNKPILDELEEETTPNNNFYPSFCGSEIQTPTTEIQNQSWTTFRGISSTLPRRKKYILNILEQFRNEKIEKK